MVRYYIGLLIMLAALSGCTPRTAQTPSPPSAAVPTRPANDSGPRGPEETASGSAGANREAPQEALAGNLAVGVPCGLAMAYKEVRTAFLKANPGVKFTDRVKNIGPLTKEVRDGKTTLDVFLSLGEREIQTLTEAGLVDGEPVPFLRQALQLIVRLGNPLKISKLEDLAKPEVKTVAVCDPMLTIGYAGEQALRKAGVWDGLVAAGKVVRPDQPLKAKKMVIERKADAAFIYGACSSNDWREKDPERSVAGKADVVMTVPDDLYGGMFAVAAVLTTARDPGLARRFVEFLLTPAAQDGVAKWGYGRIDGKEAGQ